jgi:YD repeat-containing protein
MICGTSNSPSSTSRCRSQRRCGTFRLARGKYDWPNRLTAHNRIGNATRENIALDYGAIENLTRKTDCSTNVANVYSYTANTHRVASVQLAGGQTASFAHDAAGNITSRQIGATVTNVEYDIDNLAPCFARIERLRFL